MRLLVQRAVHNKLSPKTLPLQIQTSMVFSLPYDINKTLKNKVILQR